MRIDEGSQQDEEQEAVGKRVRGRETAATRKQVRGKLQPVNGLVESKLQQPENE